MSDASGFFQLTSYGKTSLSTTVTPVIRMPKTSTYYKTSITTQGELLTDALAAALVAGFNNESFSFTIFAYTRLFNGPATGSKLARWVNTDGLLSAGILSHELGHCFGVGHANLWQSDAGSIDKGTILDYGDAFDMMGGATFALYATFNVKFRYQLGWLPEGDVPLVTSTGVYRLWTSQSASGTRGLRIAKDSQRTYWLEHRGVFGTNTLTANGVLVRIAYQYDSGSFNDVVLLDQHPDGQVDDANDAPLLIGQTYSDRDAGIHFTPIANGGSNSASYVDVLIEFGTFAANRTPSLNVTVPATLAAGGTGNFSASATDADGDTVRYHWTFRTPNRLSEFALGSSVSKQLPAGLYVVTCFASDGKGGTATASRLLTVGTPFSSTRSISGRTTLGANGIGGVALVAPDTTFSQQRSRSDGDGNYVMVTRTGAPGAITPSLTGYSFTPVATNIAASGNLSGLNFTASAKQNQLPQITLGTSYPVVVSNSTQTVGLGAVLSLYANAIDPDGTIRRVEFYDGATPIGVDSVKGQTDQSAYVSPYLELGLGVHTLKARAVDETGATAESNTVIVNVTRSQGTVDLSGHFKSPQNFGSIEIRITGSFGVNYRVLINTLIAYHFTVPIGGTYTITPSGEGESFSPTSRTLTNVQSDTVTDFEVVTERASTAPPALPPVGAVRFVPVTPCRIADTRNATGSFGGPILGGGQTRDFFVPFSSCGIPSNAAAYSVNVTVVPSGALSYLTLWPTGESRPVVSTLNSFEGSIVAHAALVPAGVGGGISVFATNPTHVILDINGYFVPESTGQGLAFYATAPCRIADSRGANGTFGGPQLAAGQARSFPIPQSACGIPGSAQAYSLNVTVVPPGPLSFLTAWPTGQTQPLVSTLNSFEGSVVANAALVPAGTAGAVNAYVTDRSDVILDINGYFGPAGSSNALRFFPVSPCRVADTRSTSVMAGGSEREFAVPVAQCGIPGTAKAYSLNVTVVPAEALGYLSAWPTGSARPTVSTLNSFLGRVVANAAIVPAGLNGAISIFVTNRTEVILDINGYFAP